MPQLVNRMGQFHSGGTFMGIGAENFIRPAWGNEEFLDTSQFRMGIEALKRAILAGRAKNTEFYALLEEVQRRAIYYAPYDPDHDFDEETGTPAGHLEDNIEAVYYHDAQGVHGDVTVDLEKIPYAAIQHEQFPEKNTEHKASAQWKYIETAMHEIGVQLPQRAIAHYKGLFYRALSGGIG